VAEGAGPITDRCQPQQLHRMLWPQAV
jgi:hypothetical protein